MGRGARGIAVVAASVSAACSLFVSLEGYSTDGATDAGDEKPVTAAEAGSQDACANAPSDPALVGYYDFDELAGTVVRDCSGRGHDGIIVDTPDGGSWSVGRFGSAIQIDGQRGCVDLGAPSDFALASGAFSVTAWVWIRPYDGGQSHYAIGRTRNPNTAGWRLDTEAPDTFQFKVALPDAAVVENNASGIPAQTWVHVAVVYEPGARHEIWVDGQKAGTQPAPPVIAEDQTATLRIGCRGDNGFDFDGKIDDVRIYKRALGAAEIQAIAAAK